jgi:DNA-binding MarR family transcriptional regulator
MSGETIEEIASQYARGYPETDAAAIELSYRMSAAANAMRSASDRLFASFGPDRSRNRFGVVRVLYFSEAPEMSQNRLSEALNLPPSTVTYFVDALERDGLVTRKPHPTDKRVSMVEITPAGRQLCEELVPAIALHMRKVASVFTKEETQLFNELLTRFRAAAESSLNDE